MASRPMTALLIALSLGPACARHGPLPETAVVVTPVENMHRMPTDSSDVVSQAILGTNVRLLRMERSGDGADWYEVETPDTYRGWIVAQALKPSGQGQEPYASSGKVFVVSALWANIYREPDVTKHKPLIFAPASAVLEVTAERDERWIEIRLPNGSEGWVQRGDGDIREAPWTWPRLEADERVALAMRFLGLPYLWGGTSPLGFDCSGFVQLVYKMSGVPLLRDADIQFEKSGLAEVPPGSEAAGDLVFFGRAKDRITHVGMMIDAERFINATTHERPVVRIDQLSDPYWQKIYQGARRPRSD